MKDKKGPADKFTDLIDSVGEIVEDNKDLINKASEFMSGDEFGDSEIKISDMENLSEVRSMEDKFVIVAETQLSGMGEIGIEPRGNRLIIGVGEKKIVAKNIPDNLVIGDSDATMNNGVLTVEIPREKDTSSSVTETDGDL
jgi:HSP20 family molecular chaperone IbpA